MTHEELIQREIDLDIEVTPDVEDAFYFINHFEKTAERSMEEWTDDELKYADDCNKAGNRVASIPYEARLQIIHYAYRMIDNLKKYGVACKAWEK